jgi:NTE family protein
MPPQKKTINLALQGGGSHGAFTWGVLDKLLEDGRLEIDGVCGTSAGAMNAVVFAYGKMKGGNEGARELLHKFWENTSLAGYLFNPIRPLPWEMFISGWNMNHSLIYALFQATGRGLSPYQFNPLNLNPLKNILEETVNFEELRTCNSLKMFINTTQVSTGQIRIFHNHELSADVIMASAALPVMYQAVEIEGEYFWDGGYLGNPAIYPLIYHADALDILLVHINPQFRKEIPSEAIEIENRIQEISFNSPLLGELRAIAFVNKLIEEDWLKDEHKSKLKHLKIHSIRPDSGLSELGVTSKLNSDWEFLTYLRDFGRDSTEEWLKANYDHIGLKSTVDIKGEFLTVKSQEAPPTIL